MPEPSTEPAAPTRRSPNRRAASPAALVSLLIPSHALPPFSYLVPDHLAGSVRVGTAVVAPLSGYGRLGVVVGFEREGERPLKEIQALVEDLSLPKSLVELCVWAAGAAAQPLHAVLRSALPPELKTSAYKVLSPAPGWPWPKGATVNRAELRRTLKAECLKAAEAEGRLALSPVLPTLRTVEWATLLEEIEPTLLRRAPRQRALLGALKDHGGARPVRDLLQAAGAGRASLKQLVQRGAVVLENRPKPAPVSYARGSGAALAAYRKDADRALRRAGVCWVWRLPSREYAATAAAVARASARRGGQTLVLAPEIETVERLARDFVAILPAGLTVAPYHSALGRGRAAAYEAARKGEVDVLVGTRAAALVPMASLGAVCVVDEPNGTHRADPGHEGVCMHARDLAKARARIEGAVGFLLSPTPSLRTYVPESGTLRLPPRKPDHWPAVEVVDMRGTGAALSSALLNTCREALRSGGRVGVLVNRLGRATSLSCGQCGFVISCHLCERPLALHGASDGTRNRLLACMRCGRREGVPSRCPSCGSDRLVGTGLAVERVRADLAGALRVEVGLLTAGERVSGEARVVVGTPRCVLGEEWDLVAVPDADTLLFGPGSIERGFGLLYGAAEASRERLLVQTRSPDHPSLLAALRGDYETFAAAEMPKRRALGYPPYGHLAEITLEGPEKAARLAVESSRTRPVRRSGVEVSDAVPVPAGPDGSRTAWRLLVRGRERGPVASAASFIARAAARSGKVRARIEVDPEEV